MWGDILLQAGLILVTIFMFLAMHNIPQNFIAKLRQPSRRSIQAKRHFVLGAQLLSKARSSSNSRSATSSLAKQAESEADKAIALDPKDAAAHILKALCLDLQGFKTSALEALDVALSPLAAKSLSEGERIDALVKRAEVSMGVKGGGRVESAIEDLKEAVKYGEEEKRKGKVYCMLGECYEMKKMREEAKEAYEMAIKVEPHLLLPKQALERLAN